MLMGRRQALGPVVPRQLRDSAPRHRRFASTRFLLLASRPAEPFDRLGSVRLDTLVRAAFAQEMPVEGLFANR